MSATLAFATYRNHPSGPAAMHRRRYLFLLAGLAGAILSPCLQAENVTRVVRQHVENWNQALLSGNIDDILDLYSDAQPMLLQPDGKVATSAVEIARFWRILLAEGDTKFRFRLIDAHQQGGMIVARLALSHPGLQQQTALAGGHGGICIYCVIKRQQNGQWKTQIQKWC